MPHKSAQNLFCRKVVIMFVKSWSWGQSFHNFTMHALCNRLHLCITSHDNSWKTGRRSTLPFQAMDEASLLALHNVAGSVILYVVISRASNCAER